MLGPLEEVLAEPDGAVLAPRPQPRRDGASQRPAAAEAGQHAARFLAHRGGPGAGALRADRSRRLHRRAGQRTSARRSSGPGSACVSTAPPLPQPVYVDRDMWEKIVLNLLSNAFKFTLRRRDRASTLRDADGTAVELRGRATPASAFPATSCRGCSSASTASRARAAARIEGTGIGLALVQELVRLHGGTIAVESEVGAGTTFSVAHAVRHRAPAGRPRRRRRRQPAALGRAAEAYVQEALRWLPATIRPVDSMRALPVRRT